MNNPFDNQSDETSAMQSLQQPQEALSQYANESSADPDFSNDSVVPGVASASSKKKILLLIVVAGLLIIGGLLFFLLSSDSTLPTAPEPTLAAPVVPITPPSDMSAPIAPIAPATTALPTLPAAEVSPAAPANVHPCEQRMIDHATQNGADPKAYVSQNQAYLEQCKQAMAAGAQ